MKGGSPIGWRLTLLESSAPKLAYGDRTDLPKPLGPACCKLRLGGFCTISHKTAGPWTRNSEAPMQTDDSADPRANIDPGKLPGGHIFAGSAFLIGSLGKKPNPDPNGQNCQFSADHSGPQQPAAWERHW